MMRDLEEKECAEEARAPDSGEEPSVQFRPS